MNKKVLEEQYNHEKEILRENNVGEDCKTCNGDGYIEEHGDDGRGGWDVVCTQECPECNY